MKIENYGVGQRCAEAMRLLMEWEHEGDFPDGVERVILLPIPSARDGTHLTGSSRLLGEVLDGVKKGELVAGYSIPERDTEYIRSRGGVVYDAATDEEFVEENSEISAIGAVKYLLSEFSQVPSDMRIGIVGYGRIGSRITRILLFLGAKIRVYTTKDLTRVELGECGVETCHINYEHPVLARLSELDVLINTAPTPLSESFPGGKLPEGLCVIELASGNNFDGVEGVVRLMSIPDRQYPRSAGRAYFHAIQKYMREVF